MPTDLAHQARFVFRGTVTKLNAVTMASIRADDRTLVARVDETIQAPGIMIGFDGSEITILLGPKEELRPGEEAIFYTNPWMFGQSIAVKSIGHHAVDKMPRFFLDTPRDSVQRLAQSDMESRLETADLVVTGKVSSLKPVRSSKITPLSEHDPNWHDALIAIKSVERGRLSQKKITVRFAKSDDIAWHGSPKFHKGQEGVWFLRKREKAGKAYSVLHKHDFHSIEKTAQIRALLKQVF